MRILWLISFGVVFAGLSLTTEVQAQAEKDGDDKLIAVPDEPVQKPVQKDGDDKLIAVPDEPVQKPVQKDGGKTPTQKDPTQNGNVSTERERLVQRILERIRNRPTRILERIRNRPTPVASMLARMRAR